jgi:beta-galactosidase/beta-glucuronidase
MSSIPPVIRASEQDGTYPRPQLVRSAWTDLTGSWDFAVADAALLPGQVAFDRTIVVPFPPESPASGVGETSAMHAVWYRRNAGANEFAEAGWRPGQRMLLHFGAVDWTARVWVNGQLVTIHEGGQTPFSADITAVIEPDGDNEIVVCAQDDPEDVSILRGKQDWRDQPHVIWYHRTTGIWQSVWLEAVPSTSIRALALSSDVPSGTVTVQAEIDGPVGEDTWLSVRLDHAEEVLAETRVRLLSPNPDITVAIPRQANGQQYEELLWTPECPTLVDVSITVHDGDRTVDAVSSYVGMRSIALTESDLLLNDRPIQLRAVLAQNYWPESHLAAPSVDALRREVELILELGFNTARVHQKAEDPRFLFWADRLGLMLWAETASAYAFNRRAARHLVSEWTALVERDLSHPSVIAWVPLNESWGVQHIAHDPRQRALSRGITDLTRALDGTRPVISNDGWEHTNSDIVTIHDYEGDPDVIAARYGDEESIANLLSGMGPAGRRILMDGPGDVERPVMLTEFGGVSLQPGDSENWGYSTVGTTAEFGERVCDLLRAARQARPLIGFCYTQLTDTGQETNGILYADRTPKVPVDELRRAIQGN